MSPHPETARRDRNAPRGPALLLLLASLLAGCATPPAPPRVEFGDNNTLRIPLEETTRKYGSLPVIVLSMNGVPGRFVVDTGASGPMFTRTAVKAWHLKVSDSTGSARLADGTRARASLIEDVTLELAPRVRIHWKEVYLSPESDSPYFGLIDYHTLKAVNAVIDTGNKMITISR
ncbi:MAG: retropepsin-like aspartic protease [Verrucomicrobiota bacterium]